MRVNINCSSALGKLGACGYAFWINGPRGSKSGRGHSRWPVKDSITAEIISCVNSLNFAVKKEFVQLSDIVTIQTRNKQAFNILCLYKISEDGFHKNLINNMQKLEKEHQLKLTFKHTPSRNSVGKDQWNSLEACHRYARKEMFKIENLLKTQENLNPQKICS